MNSNRGARPQRGKGPTVLWAVVWLPILAAATPSVAPDPAGRAVSGVEAPAARWIEPLGPDATSAETTAGTVEGVVRIQRSEASPPPRLSPYSRRRYSPPAGPASAGFDAVVFVRSPAESGAGAPSPASIVQRDLEISPALTVVRAGTRIAFPNEDDVFHNLFSLSDPGPFNLGRYGPGESRNHTFAQPGVVRMFCDIHPEMEASILILDTPFFARPDDSGAFRIEGLPEGSHTVVLWHPTAGSDSVRVEVRGDRPARVDLSLGG